MSLISGKDLMNKKTFDKPWLNKGKVGNLNLPQLEAAYFGDTVHIGDTSASVVLSIDEMNELAKWWGDITAK